MSLTPDEAVDYGFDPKKPVIEIAARENQVKLKDFFRSLRSPKIRSPFALKLMWRTNDMYTPVAECAYVRLLIESMTQVYLRSDDPQAEDPSEEEPYNDPGDWAFIGRIMRSCEKFDPSPDAECSRVRGFVTASALIEGDVEDIYLQVTDNSVDLPPDSGYGM